MKSSALEGLPDYDPVKNVISISEWIHKIESYAELYDWDDIAIRHYGLSKLTGVAKTWRDSITKQPECWADWCELLRENFAFEDDCLTLRLAAQNYKWRYGQDIVEYYFEKLAKCNKCKMQDKETSLIVGHPYTEQPNIVITSKLNELKIEYCQSEVTNCVEEHSKTELWAQEETEETVIPNNYLGHIAVKGDLQNYELCIEGGMREGRAIPRCVIQTDCEGKSILPILCASKVVCEKDEQSLDVLFKQIAKESQFYQF
ncbi:hypothetical protein QE152_g22645 [Popillia japonica]|uniref:Retrotransposon gag domain-containing protein n=1 Tax=Popillia japonica TaxID=7064 RepID=A0AAW1KL65_POPJA